MASQSLNNIIASGTGYIKYYDGTLICFGEEELPSATYSPAGNLYNKDFDTNISFAQPFYAEPKLVLTCSSGSVGIVSHCIHTYEKITQIAIMRHNANGSALKVQYIAIGRWKA